MVDSEFDLTTALSRNDSDDIELMVGAKAMQEIRYNVWSKIPNDYLDGTALEQLATYQATEDGDAPLDMSFISTGAMANKKMRTIQSMRNDIIRNTTSFEKIAAMGMGKKRFTELVEAADPKSMGRLSADNLHLVVDALMKPIYGIDATDKNTAYKELSDEYNVTINKLDAEKVRLLEKGGVKFLSEILTTLAEIKRIAKSMKISGFSSTRLMMDVKPKLSNVHITPFVCPLENVIPEVTSEATFDQWRIQTVLALKGWHQRNKKEVETLPDTKISMVEAPRADQTMIAAAQTEVTDDKPIDTSASKRQKILANLSGTEAALVFNALDVAAGWVDLCTSNPDTMCSIHQNRHKASECFALKRVRENEPSLKEIRKNGFT
jgi:hypothetical protein